MAVITPGKDEQPIIRTRRLELRLFRADDAPRVTEMAGDPRVADTTLNIPHPYPDGAAKAWIATHPETWQTGTRVTYAVVDRESDNLIGAVSLALKPHSTGELGYWIGVPYWNSGYCTEAARALRDFGFDSLGLHRIEATHLVRNPASGRVMQKLGMQLEGVHRESVMKFDRFEDIAVYGILANERE